MTSMRGVTKPRVRARDDDGALVGLGEDLAMSSMFSASRRKSSSSTIVSANSSMSAGGLARTAIGIRPTRNGAKKLIAARSLRTSSATSGRWTLTTTSSPVDKTCAVDLGDRGGGDRGPSNSAKTSSSGRPNSASTMRRTVVERLRRHPVAQQANSPTSSGGKIPSPDERIWPSLM